ncbi:MAG: DNA N-6-adenine-methyltransferase [Kiloniellales bacterium]
MSVYNADAGDARRDDWETPRWLFEWCEAVWGPFHLDVAASEDNAKVPVYLTKRDGALLAQWAHSNWCNPPFSLASAFAERAAFFAERGQCSLLVLPAATGSQWFHRNVFAEAAELVFLCGRVAFIRDGVPVSGNNTDSVLAFYARRSSLSGTARVRTALTAEIRQGKLPRRRVARQLGIMDKP